MKNVGMWKRVIRVVLVSVWFFELRFEGWESGSYVKICVDSNLSRRNYYLEIELGMIRVFLRNKDG